MFFSMSILGYVKVDIVLLLLRIAYNICRSCILLEKYIFAVVIVVVVVVVVAVK